MSISTADYIAMLARTQKRVVKQESSSGVSREMDLHDEIMRHCNSQWPKWKFIRARSDMASTIAVGCQDFTCFLPGGKVLCIECKRKGAKPSIEQLAWHKEMELLGHKVFVVRSLADFLHSVTEIIQSEAKATPIPPPPASSHSPE